MYSLYNLVYVSTRKPNCTESVLQDILEESRQNNHLKNITGVLLYSDNRFLQYLEGDKEVIFSLYKQIKKDPRHQQVTLLYNVPINGRIFPSWQMGYKNLDAVINFHTEAGQAEYQLFQQLILEDAYKEIEGMDVLKLFFERA